MGIDLSGAGGYFRWTTSAWYDLLEIATEFGWVPTGTGPPPGVLKADWRDGAYSSNSGQRFYARDARAFADALDRAIGAFAAGKIKKRTRPSRSFDKFFAEMTGQTKPSARVPIQVLHSQAIENVRDFISFCREGSFRIH